MPVAYGKHCGAIKCGSLRAESPDSTMAKAGELPLQGELIISLAAWGIPQADDSLQGQQPCEMAAEHVCKATPAAVLLSLTCCEMAKPVAAKHQACYLAVS